MFVLNVCVSIQNWPKKYNDQLLHIPACILRNVILFHNILIVNNNNMLVNGILT